MRLDQIESICRLQNKCNLKVDFFFFFGWGVRKHCVKRRKCWPPAFSPFRTIFLKGVFFRVVKSRDCVVKVNTLPYQLKSFNDPVRGVVRNHCGKRRKMIVFSVLFCFFRIFLKHVGTNFELTLSQTANFRLFQIERVCTTIWSWMEIAASSLNGLKTLCEKEKLLVESNSSFSHSVFKRLVHQTRENQGLFGKELTHCLSAGGICSRLQAAEVFSPPSAKTRIICLKFLT